MTRPFFKFCIKMCPVSRWHLDTRYDVNWFIFVNICLQCSYEEAIEIWFLCPASSSFLLLLFLFLFLLLWLLPLLVLTSSSLLGGPIKPQKSKKNIIFSETVLLKECVWFLRWVKKPHWTGMSETKAVESAVLCSCFTEASVQAYCCCTDEIWAVKMFFSE